MNKSILVFDIETDSTNKDQAKLKWFGSYSYQDNKYYLLDHTQRTQIKELIRSHNILVGFNNKYFDQPILEKYLQQNILSSSDVFKYKIVVDLYEISAPKGNNGYGVNNKSKLQHMNIKLKNYSLKNIIDVLKLDQLSKGDIDYKIFKKNKWVSTEIREIKKYLKQDVDLTKKLYEWYDETFEPIKKLLNPEDVRKQKHLKTTASSLGYHVICNLADIPLIWTDRRPPNMKAIKGGHHINPRWSLVKADIVELDFSSAYPHALIMGNLFSPNNNNDGWNGSDYYTIEGNYEDTKQGKIESALHSLMLERLKAKKENDKMKNLSFKLIINSVYGICGNYRFGSIYNPTTASDCTHIVRTWMKKLAKTLEENDFQCLYGFTDSIFVKIPKESNKEELLMIVDSFIEEAVSKMPFPVDSFKMDVEEEIKMIWFIAKNCYLFVTKDDKVKYKSTLLNQNTPKSIMLVFENYMKPKIIKELNVNFTEKELVKELKELFKKDPKLSAEEYKVSPITDYLSKTSLQYQISERYGEGRHFLIPNLKGVGVGKSKSRKCTFEEFETHKLTSEDIDTTQLIKHIKEFIREKPK